MNTLKDASLKIDALKNNMVGINDYTGSEELANWRITNDSVMGGKSQGEIILAQDRVLFTGEISLENNGGFTSTFHPVTSLEPGIDTISIDVQGDGHIYQLRLVTIVDGYRLSYKQDFATSLNERQQITFKLSDFQAYFRGRNIDNAPELTSENIVEVGFLLNFTKLIIHPKKNHKPKTFSLSIFKISFD
ncbi:CIA30 family protein [Psychrosphaera saromensis]|nr:CIA30 family protein [Psychrosphaera saromensis]